MGAKESAACKLGQSHRRPLPGRQVDLKPQLLQRVVLELLQQLYGAGLQRDIVLYSDPVPNPGFFSFPDSKYLKDCIFPDGLKISFHIRIYKTVVVFKIYIKFVKGTGMVP